ncbi:unnamed protein product [Cuscuta campestris]|uniref:Ysc84 actin-binding domain-containing protein n=1 Tax=Cuscuta campestris TaxID=132261 RepID=A0A484LR38_9ASTE|nr:unnamed protein product [Cuscuta campestris]
MPHHEQLIRSSSVPGQHRRGGVPLHVDQKWHISKGGITKGTETTRGGGVPLHVGQKWHISKGGITKGTETTRGGVPLHVDQKWHISKGGITKGSPPSAILSFGFVRTFSGKGHISLGAGLSAAVGIAGRAAEAGLRAGDGGCAPCYTYSFSKGAFVGCSLEGSMVTTRTRENSRFYGDPSITASTVLLGSMPRPPAAAILYYALNDLYKKIENS